MPSIYGTIWNDLNGNGLIDPGEGPVEDVVVQLMDLAETVLATDTTDANGEYEFPGLLDGDYLVDVVDTAAWIGSSALRPRAVSIAGFIDAQVDLPVKAGKQCFKAYSSWIHEVCWVPEWGVTVTFHNRDFRPYFRCSYPGTTFADYELYVVAWSKGKHEWAYYYRRPYIPRPLT